MQNAAFQDKESEYYTWDKSWMLPFVKNGPNVILDLGCASGRVGLGLLNAGKAKELIGAEIFAPAAEEAAKTYQEVHVGDVEEMDLAYRDYFDYVICGDILEHLKEPYMVVEKIVKLLKPGGSLLACVPNVRNFRVLRDLIFGGEWKYVSSGILDRTHLRFFTRNSCRRMLTDAGLQVYHEQMIVYGTKKLLFNSLTLGCFAEFLSTQVFCCARKIERTPKHEEDRVQTAPYR
jgi:2-polyprenyl-3-methyl-5-hydroxy-6-metoxy-1,4-benzoquinol methylase